MSPRRDGTELNCVAEFQTCLVRATCCDAPATRYDDSCKTPHVARRDMRGLATCCDATELNSSVQFSSVQFSRVGRHAGGFRHLLLIIAQPITSMQNACILITVQNIHLEGPPPINHFHSTLSVLIRSSSNIMQVTHNSDNTPHHHLATWLALPFPPFH